MGNWSIYIFPRNDDGSEGFCDRAITELAKLGLVEAMSSPLENLDQVAPGDRARAFLTDGFEYAEIRKGPHPLFIPEDPAVDPRCPKCGVDLNERWYDVLNDETDRDELQDWTKPEVTCPRCNVRIRLTEVVDANGVGAHARREFIFLSDVNACSDEEIGALRAHLARALGDVVVAVYWYT